MSANKSLTFINTEVNIPRRSSNSSNFGNFSKSQKSINLTYKSGDDKGGDKPKIKI